MMFIFTFSMIILIGLTVYALLQTDKCPKCRSRDWELKRDCGYYKEMKCRNCGEERVI